MGREICFIWGASNWGGGRADSCPKADSWLFPHPHPDNQWARTFIGWRRGLHAETAQSALTVILKLVISDNHQWLTSDTLIVLGTVNLQFQGWLVSISEANSQCWASQTAQLVKNLPAMQETLVQFLGWEDPLGKGKATHSSILVLEWLWGDTPCPKAEKLQQDGRCWSGG